MTTTIKITELTNIGANLASSTVIPVVNMAGTPTTEKTVLGNVANFILAGAGGNYVAAAKATTATTANTVLTNAQPNITSVGNLTGLTVSNASGVVNFSNTANVTLGAVGNLRITGGSNGQVLTTNGSGNLSWTTVSGGGGSNTGNIGFDDTVIYSNSGLIINNSDPTHGQTAGLSIPAQGDGNATQLFNTYGNVILQAANIGNSQPTKTWTFGSDGTTIFPTANVDLHNGGVQSGQVLQFGDVSQQAIITGPTPPPGQSAQRLIIQGQNGNTGEGGDVYVWAGDADTNGGDIKIYAGDADNASAGSGGYINLAGGAGFDNGGDITLNGGYSANGYGGQISITGGQGQIDGGPASITGGYATAGNGGAVNITGGTSSVGPSAYGNVEIGSGIYGWSFNNEGNLVLPGNTFAVNYANGTQVSIGGGSGNTGNVTFDDNIVIGTGDEFGSAGLFLAPGNGSIANSAVQYLRVRGGDYPTHIHLDTGNNQYYDQYFGADSRYVKLEANGNIVINADDYAGNSSIWNFDINGKLTVPGNIQTVTTGFPFTSTITGINTGSPTVIVTLTDSVFGAPETGRVTISGVVGTTEANDTWYFSSIDPSNFVLYYDQELQNPVDGTSWTTYVSGGLAVAAGYSNISITGGNVTIVTNTSNTWTFTDDGNLILGGGNSVIQSIASSSLDPLNPNVSTMVLTPDQGYNAQSLVLDPTAPGHIHLRAPGANIDEPSANIFLGGEDSSFEVGYYNGSAPNVFVHSGGNTWTFGTDGNLTIPDTSSVLANVSITLEANDTGNSTGLSLIGDAHANLYAHGNVTIVSDSGNTTATWNFDETGNLSVPGNLIGPDNANFTIYSNVGQHEFVFGDDGTFYAPDDAVLGGNTIYIGPGANTLAGLEHAVLIASSNHFAYIQGVINNISDNGSADWVAQGRLGSDEGGWADFGFTSGGFNDANYTITGPGDGYLLVESYAPGQLITGPKGGNLILATGSQGTVRDIIFGTGGFETGNIFGRMSDANNSFELSRAGATITFPDATEQNTAWTGSLTTIANGNSNVSITTANGNVVINASNDAWTFDTNGNLTLPTGGQIIVSGGLISSGASPAPTFSGFNITNHVGVTGTGNISGNNISATGNISANNFTGNGGTLSNVATKVEGSWTLASGVNTVSINVPLNGTYTIWVNGNIPNGIVTYTATAVVTNTNVPVLGEQYAWYYSVGNALVFTSIPNQFTGTVGSISNVNTYLGNTANVFTFGITNNSGNTAVVNYGYTKL